MARYGTAHENVFCGFLDTDSFFGKFKTFKFKCSPNVDSQEGAAVLVLERVH